MSTTTEPPSAAPAHPGRRRPARRPRPVRPGGLPRRGRRYVVYDATTLDDGFADRPCSPRLRRTSSAACCSCSPSCWRSRRRGATSPRPRRARTSTSPRQRLAHVGLLVAAFLANIVLIDWLGWAITGAFLFVGAACALGSRTLLRDLALGVALSVGTWYASPSAWASRSPPASWTGCCDGPAARRLRHRPDAREPALRRRSACCSAPPSGCCPASARP